MLAIKLIAEGLGLGLLLYLICAAGICNGAVGMVYLYDQKVQDRYTQLGQRAMKDAMGQAAGLTGGYGTSYGQESDKMPLTSICRI